MSLPSSIDASLANAESHTITRTSQDHGSIDLHVVTLGPTDGPLILCVHGWPENWYSWRHQMTHFTELGYRVAAMDVRGYGQSSKPENVAAYTIAELAGDAAAVISELSPAAPAILFGHDWGARSTSPAAETHRSSCGLASNRRTSRSSTS